MEKQRVVYIYIGSSVDLARRMEEYNNLMIGSRKPKTRVERELSNLDSNTVSVIFCPHLFLI